MGPVLWPKSVTRSFWRRRQVDPLPRADLPARTRPRVPPFDFARRRLILVAAGPRSSTGYGVRIVRITERRSTIDVLAREATPSLGSRVGAAADLAVPADHDPRDLEARLRTVAGPPVNAPDDPVLRQFREQISDTDRAIVDAINTRLELVAQIKAYKESRGIDFLDPERERVDAPRAGRREQRAALGGRAARAVHRRSST